MQVEYERCCGLDVHKETVVACAIVPAATGQPQKETRTFATMTENLSELAAWLRSKQVTHVTMESTGVYWKPVYNLLDGHFEILVVNAEHVKALKGRKTDVQDAEWSFRNRNKRTCCDMVCSRAVSFRRHNCANYAT